MAKSRRYRLGPIILDAESHTLRYDGKERRLGPKSSRTLEVLVEARLEDPDRFLSRDFLTAKVWPPDEHVERNNLDIIIQKLRRILDELDPDPAAPKRRRLKPDEHKARRHIEASRGAGFRYIGPVERLLSEKVVIAAREPEAETPEECDVLGVVLDVSDGILARAREMFGKEFVVLPTSEDRYQAWLDEQRELKAEYVLSLKVWKHGGLWRASAKILNEGNRSLKCSKQFKAPVKNYYRLRNEIIHWVVRSLGGGGGR